MKRSGYDFIPIHTETIEIQQHLFHEENVSLINQFINLKSKLKQTLLSVEISNKKYWLVKNKFLSKKQAYKE